MSIKDLFGKTSRNLEDTVQDVESVAFVEEKTKADQTYHPQIDFSDPKNFVYYGSAELYYDAAIRRIYQDYPYDGSKSEQIAFEHSASALERWVFENKYPKTTGHIQLGTTEDFGSIVNNIALTGTPEYIRIWGGLHTDSSATNLADHFESSAKFDADKNRNQNWNCDFDEGVTVEFWMKKESFDLVNNPYEIVLDLWNGDGPATEKRLVIGASALSGTDSLIASIKDGLTPNSSALIDLTSLTGWNHFAFTFYHENDQVKCDTFVNGDMVGSTTTLQSSRMDFTGKVDGFIGALQTVFNSAGAAYAGKFEGYLDEFRFWKTKRTARQIKLNWFNGVGGGSNTDDATSDLGVYLKFNEGIVGNNTVDSVVLDYSGRLANGTWIGYPGSAARSTDSAINLSGYTEAPSPIIYSTHPSVSSLVSEMQTSGSSYDADRGQAFFRSMPTWLQEEDNGNLRLFSQILGSYMDTLHVQIKELTELKTKRYPTSGIKASTLAADLLKDKGFMISTMFENDEVYEKLAAVNLQDNQFETELHEIKNIIYTNIYNNLEKIYKSKGTEGSIRNLIRCYGIDDELIRLNLYTDGGTQYFTDKARETSVKKKYVNFNDPDHFDAVIYQVASLPSNPNSYIAASADASRNAFTMEADIVVPHKKEVGEAGYFDTSFISASVMGFHEAAVAPADFTWGTQNLCVYLVRDSVGSRNAKFVLKNEAGTIKQESDFIYDIYENEHYNVAVRIKPQTYPYAGGVTNTAPNYDVELYAVTTNFGEVEQEVILSQTISNADGLALMNASKRVYAGAHLVNFTGATAREKSDIQVGGVRVWLDYLENDEILQHNKDVLNYGMRSSVDGSNLYLVDDIQIPTQDLSILNWDFDTVTTSDGSGEFVVEDITSGHTDTIYGTIDNIIRREHKAKGANFPLNDVSVFGYEFIQAYKKQLPESAYDAQNIYIKGEQEINFSDDDDVSDNLFVMEKSPSALISEEMLKSFSTTVEFANLIGRPVDRYRVEYKDLAKARQLFFDKVERDIDFDRFFEYFKWIDSNISSMVNQLIPLSANFAGGIVDVIEPHILERDKYQRQVGLLSTVTSTEASMRGVQEQKYNWRTGHAPLSGDQNENCLWQKERREGAIIDVLTNQNEQSSSNPINLSGSNGVYQGNTYATRRFSRPYSITADFNYSIHGGINYSINKNRDALTDMIPPGNSSDGTGAPEGIVTVAQSDTNPKPACIDENKPPEISKYKYDGFAVVGKESGLVTQAPRSDENHYAYRQKISKIFPGNIMSSSVNTGYSAMLNQPGPDGGLGVGLNVVNLHSDTTDITNVIPIQGPFTQEHIGGRQVRHIHITEAVSPDRGYVTSSFDRPEFWGIYRGLLDFDLDGTAEISGALGITTPDYQLGSLDSDSQKATYFREERAKRPVNIKNIRTDLNSGPHGNFIHNYEVLSTFGDQDYYFRRMSGSNLLPADIGVALPETTNYHTLIAQSASVSGNYFGANNNRQVEDIAEITEVKSVASFIFHQNSTGGTPSSIGTQSIVIQRATGGSIDFKIADAGGGASGTSGGGYTVVDTDGATWANIGDQFKIALESANGFGSNVLVTYAHSVGAFGDQVVISIKEQTLEGTAGDGGALVESSSHINLIFSTFQGGVNPIAGVLGNIIQTQDRSTGSISTIRTRFSAPGGPEINSPAYLDVATQQYSVHNSMNFRNLSVVGSGSGEEPTIRVNSHSNRREGLRTLRSRHQGQFGLDSLHGAVSSTVYADLEASFHKQHRNNQEKITPVDKTSRGMTFAHTNAEYASIASLNSQGEVNNTQEGLSFSFWVKFDGTTPTIRGFFESTNFKAYYDNSGQRIYLRLKKVSASYATAAFDVSGVDFTTNWRHLIISVDMTDTSLTKLTIDGSNVTLAASTAITSGDPALPFSGVLNVGAAEQVPASTTKYELHGSIMNFAYFNKFIHNNPRSLSILENHTNRSDIEDVEGLVNFWFFGDETALSSGDTVPNSTTIESSFGSYTETFTILNPGASSNINIVDGFYGYVGGERQDEQRFDNDHFHSLLPASDFQYSWINNTLSGSNSSGVTWASQQRVIDFAPRNGVVAVRGEGYVPALVFPTISDINCGDHCSDDTVVTISITYDTEGGDNTVTEDTSLYVTSGLPGTSIQINELKINDIVFTATYSGCCETDLEYRVVADDDNSEPYVYDSGYHSSPAGPIASIPAISESEAVDKKVYLIFFVRDCEGNVYSLTITLNTADFT